MKYVAGVGSSKYGKHESSDKMILEAVGPALKDAEIKNEQIDAIVISTLDMSSGSERQRHHASRIHSLLKTTCPVFQIPAACAGGGVALHAAEKLEFDNVLVVGFDHCSSLPTSLVQEEYLLATERRWEQPQGMIFPAQAALLTSLYEQKFGDTVKKRIDIAEKNHQLAYEHPKAAFYQKRVPRKKMENAEIVASPLTKYDCAITVDGASAVVLSKEKTKVKMRSAVAHDTLTFWERDNLIGFQATEEAARKVLDEVSIKNIDVVEVHDAFTIMEILAYDDLGMIKQGESVAEVNERFPTNLSGGLKAKGHPVSASGVGQIVELTQQLRQVAEGRQVEQPRWGLAQNMGGVGSTVSVTLLRRCY